MNSKKNLTLDAAVAVALVAALVVVSLFDRAPAKLEPPKVEVKEVQEELPVAAQPLRLAVTPRQYDDMGKLLDQLGEGYKYTKIKLEDLEHLEKIKDYDVIFATCGTVPDSWVSGAAIGAGARPGVRQFQSNKEVEDRVREALRGFVGKGGTLYASDWRRGLVQWAFPEFFDGGDVEPGSRQTVTVKVVDPGLRNVIGPELSLRFDMNGWFPGDLSDPKMTTYLEGEYKNVHGETVKAPLLVKVPFEEGAVIFTSFHNEKQNSEKELDLLRFLVFAAVTAKETEKANKIMVQGGFSPREQSLIGASAENPSVTKTYRNAKAGALRFVLGFQPGARFRLVVTGPSGQKAEKEGASTFTIDVPGAPVGDWSYTITALKLPYANFPFTLTVGGE